jgi:hypothetical protein
MIQGVRNIASTDPGAEVWKYLRLYLNKDRTGKLIRQIHNVPADAHEANVLKQCTQVGYCIRQAEEYFRASEIVGLATKPLLLYYGCVALSRALVLIKHDGTYSLDVMRKTNKHRHHGLTLSEGAAELAAKTNNAADFFASIRCSCYLNKAGSPWGHWPIFYAALDPSVFIERMRITESDRQAFLDREAPHPSADVLRVEQLKNREVNCLELLKGLPDLFGDLSELGISTYLARGSTQSVYAQYFGLVAAAPQPGAIQAEPAQGVRQRTHIVETRDFFIDGITENERSALWDFLHRKNAAIIKASEFPTNLHLSLTTQGASEQEINARRGYCPDIIDDINGQKLYILRPEEYVHECGALLAIMFCLGMLSRYFPDIWMKTIERNVDVVEVTNSLLTVVTRKFPNLILDQISGVKHFIHL